MDAPQDILGENTIALSFSGGGLRAAAFAHGVLRALKETKTPTGDLLDDIGFISSVSGGSLVAAHFGLHGREGLDGFRENVLLRDFEADMRLSLGNPSNLLRIFGGGLNAREEFGDSLDKHVFHGATFADLYKHRKPDVRIHATDLYNRIPFPFIPRVFSILCSDIRSYSVADAVVASMAVPVVFAPVVVRAYPENCNEPLPALFQKIRDDPDASRVLKAAEHMSSYRDPTKVKYLKLVDGGVTDNFGLGTIAVSRAIMNTPYAPMTERDAVKVRRLLFIVVDASRGPSGDWTMQEYGPGGVDLAVIAGDAATDASSRFAADAFGQMVRDWQESLVSFRCGLKAEDVARLGGPKDWQCADVRFYLAFLSIDRLDPAYRSKIEAIPTRLTLPVEQIDDAIEGARRGTLALPRLRQYVFERMK
ncbi:hypothetical protein BWI17_07220 [Betaproteobacteria bacterium GR16-43]|nr:hypothetical protein BWI17_07220 [Betaproteobacteria bacterium GR16-43]